MIVSEILELVHTHLCTQNGIFRYLMVRYVYIKNLDTLNVRERPGCGGAYL